MTYTSIYYFVLVIATVLLYYAFTLHTRWIILLAGSLIFYGVCSFKGMFFLIGAAVVSYGGAILLKMREGKMSGRRLVFIISLLLTVLPLVMLKITRAGLFENLAVPLGISFYTLQMAAYLMDTYRNKIRPETDFLKYLLFISFFPAIVQGPIARFEKLSGQLIEGHKFDEDVFVKGFRYILYGFFLKLVIADRASIAVDAIFGNSAEYKGYYILVAGVLYSIQLYTDFLSCIVISQGVSFLFGIQLGENFDRPYFAESIKDFWRKWHISLSSWLRDYVYIPLGGNRKGRIRKYINLLVTFMISGMWHGNGYKFIFWGILHGFYQIAGEMTQSLKEKVLTAIHLNHYAGVKRTINRIMTFVYVMIAWIIFRADSLRVGIRSIVSIITDRNPWIFFDDSLLELGLDWKEWVVLLLAVYILFCIEKKSEIKDLDADFMRLPAVIRGGTYIMVILCVMSFGVYGFGFDAKDFIYGGF